MLLEIVTRCYQRPLLLEQNIMSLCRQSSQDWQQTFLVDPVGRGVPWANMQLAALEPIGSYVWILDDDDACAQPRLVEELAEIVKLFAPPAIMLRMDHGPLGILPDDAHWQHKPQLGGIGASAIVSRSDIWLRYREAWATARYESDFDYIAAVYAGEADAIYWHNCIGSKVQRISRGEPCTA